MCHAYLWQSTINFYFSPFTFLKKTSQINISRWNPVVLVICSRQTKKRKEKEDEYGCCLKAALGLLCPEAHRCNVKNVTFRCMIDRFPQLWFLCKYNYATLKHPPFLGVAYMLVHASYVGTLVHIKKNKKKNTSNVKNKIKYFQTKHIIIVIIKIQARLSPTSTHLNQLTPANRLV